MKYIVNNTILGYDATGPVKRGEDKVLLSGAMDITATTEWHNAGFTIKPLLGINEYPSFQIEIERLVKDCWRRASLHVDTDFPLDQYHTVARDSALHYAAVQETKLLSTQQFPFGINWIEERISEFCNQALIARNPFDGQSIFHFRVIRPQQNDNNPLHRDVWLEDYDDCINLYIPVCGSDENSSLILIPGSHVWPESRIEKTDGGAVVGGLKYNVPAVTRIFGEYQVVRPNPDLGQVLIFSPYLIHGGAVNLNTDRTRISVEMRLWKKS